jgi:hypothetical protein
MNAWRDKVVADSNGSKPANESPRASSDAMQE